MDCWQCETRGPFVHWINDYEFIELFNAGSSKENLRNWQFADHGTDQFVIASDLMIAPGQHLVLARNGIYATNGGMTVDYAYGGMSLGNTDDEILLISPSGVEVDRVAWGAGSTNSVRNGASLERTDFLHPGTWAVAHSAWPGSTGDWGSPGHAYVVPPAEPTATPPPISSTPEPTTILPWDGTDSGDFHQRIFGRPRGRQRWRRRVVVDTVVKNPLPLYRLRLTFRFGA